MKNSQVDVSFTQMSNNSGSIGNKPRPAAESRNGIRSSGDFNLERQTSTNSHLLYL